MLFVCAFVCACVCVKNSNLLTKHWAYISIVIYKNIRVQGKAIMCFHFGGLYCIFANAIFYWEVPLKKNFYYELNFLNII